MRRFERTSSDDMDRRQRLQRDIEEGVAEAIAEHLADRYDRARFRAASTVLRLVNLKDEKMTR